MEEKTFRSVSEFNNELKLKGFKSFQIEDDSNATRIYKLLKNKTLPISHKKTRIGLLFLTNSSTN